MRASNQEFHRGIAMVKSSTPDGNTWLRNDAGWEKPPPQANKWACQAQARAMVRIAHGGPVGRLLLETAQQADRERHA